MDVPTGKLANDLRTLVSDAEALIKATADQGGEEMARIRARAEESVRIARERLKEMGIQLDTQVRENPWTAIGIAAGAALAIGFLLGRK